LGLLAALFSLVYPRANKAIYVTLATLAYPIGLVVSYLIMALLFFGVFAPIGVLLRLSGRDPLRRAADKQRASYWTRSRAARAKESYFRQF
jgi:hypothetical protein